MTLTAVGGTSLTIFSYLRLADVISAPFRRFRTISAVFGTAFTGFLRIRVTETIATIAITGF